MEFAQFIRSVDDIVALPETMNRIYFGAEFCDRLLPDFDVLARIVEQASAEGLAVTFVTPMLTVTGAEQLFALLPKIANAGYDLEIVANDYGLLHHLHGEGYLKAGHMTPVLGRLLTRQKTDMMTTRLCGHVPAATYDHYCTPVAPNTRAAWLLSRYGVRRYEIDNTRHDIVAPSCLSEDISLTLVYPDVRLAVTRFCPTALYGQTDETPCIADCTQQCRFMHFVIDDYAVYGRLYIVGNTMFYRNELLPSCPERLGVDRILHCVAT